MVAADGGNSRVRAQYLPHAKRVDTGITTVAGKFPLTDETRRLLAPRLTEGPNTIIPPKGMGLFTAPHDLGGATAHDGIGVTESEGALMDDTSSYVLWAFGATTSRFPSDVSELPGERLSSATPSPATATRSRPSRATRPRCANTASRGAGGVQDLPPPGPAVPHAEGEGVLLVSPVARRNPGEEGGGMPGVDTLDGLLQAVAEFDTDGYELQVEPAALDRARRSIEESGLLLLGELHGVKENPLVILGLMRHLGLTHLALEWLTDLQPQLEVYRADGTGLDDPLWWLGDGRVTAGHFAMLRAVPGLTVTLFDGGIFTGDWSQRDAVMAERVLAAHAEPALVVAGHAHALTSPTELGLPMGACLASARPSLRSVRIDYGTGSFYNIEPRRVRGYSAGEGLRITDDELVVGLPAFSEATVPHLPVELLRERLDL
ncbi:hypothetical protein [Nonomuraea sp. NPDC050643]|uniref:hypothetical protein n=1 Tax=Nonomuraea sp. NPDC050643 TaxID=3155660 RepID=UPI0034064DDA